MINVFDELQKDPDGAVGECDNIETEDIKQACYGTYLQIKANNNESIDVAFCDKLESKIREGCLLYARLPHAS